MDAERAFDESGTTIEALRDLVAQLGRGGFLAAYPDPVIVTLGDMNAVHEAPSGELTRAASPRGLLGALGGRHRIPAGARVWAVRKHMTQFPEKITLGRAANNDVVVPHPSISKFHAFFSRRGEQWSVHEAGSKNASRHNGVPITSELKPRAINDGDVLQFGAGPEMLWLQPEALYERLLTPGG